MGHLFGAGAGTRQHGRLDVSPLTQAVVEQAGAAAAGVAMVEAARRAAAAVAAEWEAAGKGGGEEGGQGEGVGERALLEAAMQAFRPGELSAADALAA